MERGAVAFTPMHKITDKRARLGLASRNIKERHRQISTNWMRAAMTQPLGVESERHDDAVDALVYLILDLFGDGFEESKIDYI
jgi:hypothetical protein